MRINIKNPKQGIALFLTLFLMLVLMSFVSLGTYQYISDNLVQKHYENELQVLYALDAAKQAAMWEQDRANNTWNTTTNTTCQLKGASISNGFYRVPGYNFKVKVYNSNGIISVYAHAFKGDETSPQYSKYLEYIHSPSPMYQYVIFSMGKLTFSGANLYDCKAGRIHTNNDIEFDPSGQGLRFNNVASISASGTIKYGLRRQYPAPHYLDNLDAVIDSKAPAPYYSASTAYYTTDNQAVDPGSFRYWSVGAKGVKSRGWKSYGDWVGANWGTNSQVPLIWRGEETYFYGKQYNGSGYNTDETSSYNLTKDGRAVSEIGNQATVNKFYLLYGSNALKTSQSTSWYSSGDVHFRPSYDKIGITNEQWFEIPGALPQDYTWSKYYGKSGSETPVTFYATEKCGAGNAGCQVDVNAPDTSVGWRYIKKDAADSHICAGSDTNCYNNGSFIPAQDYETGGTYTDSVCYSQKYNECLNQYCPCTDYNTCYNNCLNEGKSPSICRLMQCRTLFLACNACRYPYYTTCSDYAKSSCTSDKKYFNNLSPSSSDKSTDFFSNYTYGNDINTPASWTTRAFDSKQQKAAFSDYLNMLSDKGIEGVLNSEVPRKDPYLGKVFDDAAGISPYRQRAQDSGLYISDIDTAVAQLNAGGVEVAKKVTFYNWKTNKLVTLIDIDLGLMKDNNQAPANGVIYSKVPIRLSDATNLPGANGSGKQAVFTVISEQSVYLKGDYNTTDWKISNIATKKKVYTLSNNFNDPASVPDFAMYNEYPFVYVKMDNGQYLPEEGDPSNAVNNGVWVDATAVDNYAYYYGMDAATRTWVKNKKTEKQNNYVIGKQFANRVDGSHSYYSLFLSPYDNNTGDSTLENWYYLDNKGNEKQATKNMIGAFVNFYDATDSRYDNEYLTSLGAEEGTWDYRRPDSGSRSYPGNTWYIQNYGARLVTGTTNPYYSYPSTISSYDDRFPQASPKTNDGLLGFSGGDSWRLISKEYFEDHT